MKFPRDISGNQLAKRLSTFGYQVTRQSGSHMRLTTNEHSEHHLTIPKHNPLRVGTLAAILSDIGQHFRLTREQVLTHLFQQ